MWNCVHVIESDAMWRKDALGAFQKVLAPHMWTPWATVMACYVKGVEALLRASAKQQSLCAADAERWAKDPNVFRFVVERLVATAYHVHDYGMYPSLRPVAVATSPSPKPPVDAAPKPRQRSRSRSDKRQVRDPVKVDEEKMRKSWKDITKGRFVVQAKQATQMLIYAGRNKILGTV